MSSPVSYPAAASALPGIAVRDLLSQKPAQLWSVATNATVYTAIELMATVRVGALLVLDAGKLVGILSERDYARKVILMGRASQTTKVDAIMTQNVITVELDTTIQYCMQLMTQHRIRHLPVIESEKVVGVVSIGDVVREILKQQSHTIDELHRYVTGEPRLGSRSAL